MFMRQNRAIWTSQCTYAFFFAFARDFRWCRIEWRVADCVVDKRIKYNKFVCVMLRIFIWIFMIVIIIAHFFLLRDLHNFFFKNQFRNRFLCVIFFFEWFLFYIHRDFVIFNIFFEFFIHNARFRRIRFDVLIRHCTFHAFICARHIFCHTFRRFLLSFLFCESLFTFTFLFFVRFVI